MKVALNLLYLIERSGGVGRYMSELTGALVGAGVSVVGVHSPELPPRVRSAPWAGEVEWVELPHSITSGPPWHFATLMRAQWSTLPKVARSRGADILHGPSYIAPPRARGLAVVATVPDLIYTRYPELLDARTRAGMRLTVGPSARGADRVIAISETVRDDVVATLGVPRERVDVTALGARVEADALSVAADVLRGEHELRDAPVILCVAQKRVHKNLENLLRGFALLPDRETMLVMVGLPTPHEDELRALATSLGIEDRVRHLGWVEEAEVEGLYGLAACACLPSFEEGFGLPVIEAMARGLPVACSADGALAEVAGDAAATFNPRSPSAIAGALARVLGDGASFVEAGRARAAQFTWERCARETIQTYEKALAGA